MKIKKNVFYPKRRLENKEKLEIAAYEKVSNKIIESEAKKINVINFQEIKIAEIKKDKKNKTNQIIRTHIFDKKQEQETKSNRIIPLKSSNIPFGPCLIEFNGMNLGNTLKEKDSSLKIEPITKEIKTIESDEIKKIIETGSKVVFKCSFIYSEEIKNIFDLTKLILEGELVVKTEDNLLILTFPLAAIKIKLNTTFKVGGYSILELEASALKKINIDYKEGAKCQ